MLKYILFACLLSFPAFTSLKAQSCGNDEKYHLPYKNTYVKEPLVTENEYRVAKPQTIVPKSFKEAWQILPNPIWDGHEKNLKCIGEHGKLLLETFVLLKRVPDLCQAIWIQPITVIFLCGTLRSF